MNEQLIKYMNMMLDMEDQGDVETALSIADLLLKEYPENRADILFEKAKLEFRHSYDLQALKDFVEVYNASRDINVYELILQAYYAPNKDDLCDRFSRNLQSLKKYPYYCIADWDEEIYVLPLWQDEEFIVSVNQKNRNIHICKRQQMMKEDLANQTVFLCNLMWMDDVKDYNLKSEYKDKFMNMNTPLYFTFDKEYWQVFLQLYDIESLLNLGRVVFLIGEPAVRNYFYGSQVMWPHIIWGSAEKMNYFKTVLKDIYEEYNEQYGKNKEILSNYYTNREEKITEHIKSGQPRILFLTSQFTTVLQYHTKNCQAAAEKMGCRTKLLIEKDGIHRLGKYDIMEAIVELKPDIIFAIDYFRFHYVDLPEQIIFLSWVQDPLEHVMDPMTKDKIGRNDFVMNHFTTWKEFERLDYRKECLIDAPVPSNADVYKPYVLTKDEREQYGCDICFVCHCSDVEQYIQEVSNRFPGDDRSRLEYMYQEYYDFAYETGAFYYEKSDFRQYIQEFMLQHYEIVLKEEMLEYLANDMYLWFNQRVFRQVLVDWIIEAGFHNIKLWGDGWMLSPKYKEYAMGPAENGEILSKIYQASKIVIGNNIMTTSAARAWETMLSGGFYLSNYIPEESDVTDIRKIINVGEDLIMFYDKQDLLHKLHYYLEHEEERQIMIKKGRQVALEKMTFGKLMERTFQEVSKRLEEQY